MRSWKVLACVLLVATACGQTSGDSTTTSLVSSTTSTGLSPTTTTAASTTTSSAPTTTPATLPSGDWSVARLGLSPDVALGATSALGSGCSPGTDALPDGVWFGWVEHTSASAVDFDLACLWAGHTSPAVSNDATRLRTAAVADEALVYLDDSPMPFADWSGEATPTDNAPGLPATSPYWLFVNDGLVTELTRYPEPVSWGRNTVSWPGLVAGCCDGGEIVPPSPDALWPTEGWPADGFYSADLVDHWAWLDIAGSHPDLAIRRYLSCDEHPDLCPEWWTGDEVAIDPDEDPLVRSLPLDSTLTVVIMPIFSDTPIVGDGAAYSDLIEAIRQAREPLGDPTEDWDAYFAAVLDQVADPDSVFGVPPSPYSGTDWPIGYKGPGDSYLTFDYPPWMVLEIREGQPVLYVHLGLVAG